MTIFVLLFTLVIVLGVCGFAANLYIAGFLLSVESIESERKGIRYFYRLMIFSACYLVSFLVSPVLLQPFLGAFKSIQTEGGEYAYLYFVVCVPIAILFYYFNRKLIVWADSKKRFGREEYKKKMASKYKK